MRTKLYLGLALALLSFLPAAPAAAAQTSSNEIGDDPALWPEPQRSFFQDGPGLLMTPEQRTELRSLNPDARERAIQELLETDPIPETPANELAEGIERRRRLADAEYPSPGDARWQILFLNGKPLEKLIVDCGQVFKPMEVWTYPSRGIDPATGKPQERQLVVYRSGPGEQFRLWVPSDSKRVLYIPQMEYWLMQWEELRGRIQAVRFDIQNCREPVLRVDKATGVPGLTGAKEGKGFKVKPIDNSSYIETPRDLAAWAKAAAATDVPPVPPAVEVRSFEMVFPERDGQRMRMHTQIEVDPKGLELTPADDEKGTPVYTLVVQAVLEQDGRPFDEFRMRFRVPEPYANPIVLALDRSVRPGQPFVLRLRISDERGEAETRISRGFEAPAKPTPGLTLAKATSTGELMPGDVVKGADALVLLPPPADVVLGLWRAEAIVTGERIKKVIFKVDGLEQLTRSSAPYSAEVRLARFPTEQVIRAEGYDAQGELVAADEVIVNQPRGALGVWITDPPKGEKAKGNKARVRAEVMIPDGRRIESFEFRLNDKVATALSKPPWQADLTLPADDVVYVTAVAILDDGTRAEAVRFLRAPEYMEEVDVNLVELYVTVIDRGQLVTGLGQDDFEILEAGKPQEITKFELVENRPLTIGMLLDTSGSMAQSLAQAQSAAAGFLRSVLKPRDKAFAVSFASRTRLDMPPTDDAEGVALALSGLQAVGDTALHDAIVHSLYYFRGMTGQRALVLLSDGDDNASWFKFNDVLEYARRSGVAVYAIGFNVPGLGGLRGKLEQLANDTGGRVFYANKSEELPGVYAQIEKELRSRYLLAYNAATSTGPAGARAVEVKVKRGYKTRVSRGVYP